MESLVVQAARIDYGRIYLETILEEEELLTPYAVDKKQATRNTKVRTHLTLYLNTPIYHILSNMSWTSFCLSDANCCLPGVLPLFNLPLLTKRLCMACHKKKSFGYNLCLCAISKSMSYIFTPLCLENGMTPMFLEVSLCFVLSLLDLPEVNPLQKIMSYTN